MPKLTPIHQERNDRILKRYSGLINLGISKRLSVHIVSGEFHLTQPVISRILKPLNFGKRGGKIKSEQEHKEYMRLYNATYRRINRDKLMKSIELEMNDDENGFAAPN
jgi:hypothetical protein